ncbi:PilZ domain-containing protein [Consotaella aegiceratis]|uniref:PilZ domain-containing protein n=1 Tax=Consotaella aegiceratis TaxID=3097961 RepID=UPI002F408E93
MYQTAMAQQQSSVEPHEFQCVNVDLLGRFMLEDQSEYPCRIEAMSPGDAMVLTHATPRRDELAIFYIDHVGRLEGMVRHVFPGGFSVLLRGSERKREKLAAQLTWLANRHELDLPEDRRHERVQPRQRVVAILFEDGRSADALIIDLSLSGAAVQCDAHPAIGTRVTLGSTPGRVVRLLESGFAIEFAAVQEREALESRFG